MTKEVLESGGRWTRAVASVGREVVKQSEALVHLDIAMLMQGRNGEGAELCCPNLAKDDAAHFTTSGLGLSIPAQCYDLCFEL